MCVRSTACLCVCPPPSDIWGADAHTPLPSDADIEAALLHRHIVCLASGALADVHKFYFFAQVRTRVPV